MSKHLKFDVVDQLDPFQFVYKASRGAEDASLTLLNLITQHLEKAKSYVRILFVDFSSAFNTIEPYVLLEINVGKTKELVPDARKTKNVFVPVKVNNEPVEVVSNFKYLCTLIDNKLSFSANSDLIYKKIAATSVPLAKAEIF